METAGYAALSRQSGLLREMDIVANNLANSATTGYRQEGLVFSEFVQAGDPETASLSMTWANVRNTSFAQGVLTQTGGAFDLAIEGEGFFLVETPSGAKLTRSGAFSQNSAGDLVTLDGHRVLDAGGAAIFVPPTGETVSVGEDGTISSDGKLMGQIGVFRPQNSNDLIREGGVLFNFEGEIEEVSEPRILQSFLESSNVNAINQVTRMIEIQRAYELGQNFLDAENQRIRQAIKSLVR